ncbi:MAG: disulfide bond formation protein B [Acidimicrobiia bacterium]|nr:disulfide bond formation protein B [Acidimicrobiia bacterium]
MSVETVSIFFALLTLAALAGVVGVVVVMVAARWSPAIARFRDAAVDLVAPTALWLGSFIAAVSMVGSLYYSEVAEFAACDLCWYQRIAMYPLAIILAIAAYRRDLGIRLYSYPLVVIGAALAAYQYVLQLNPSLESGFCGVDASCTERYIWQFGFISFPFMSLVGFAMIFTLLYMAGWANRNRGNSESQTA